MVDWVVLGIVAPLASLLTGFAAASLSFTAWSVKAEGARRRKGGRGERRTTKGTERRRREERGGLRDGDGDWREGLRD